MAKIANRKWRKKRKEKRDEVGKKRGAISAASVCMQCLILFRRKSPAAKDSVAFRLLCISVINA